MQLTGDRTVDQEIGSLTMKVLITGGSGFIGSHLADAFAERGDQVTVFDCMPQIHEFRARYVGGDLNDRSAVEAAVRGQDFVIHAAGILGTHETVMTPYETSVTNILGGLNVLDAVKQYGSNLINISKPNVWLNPYSITKDCLEKFGFMYVNEFDLKIAMVKLYNVYGPRQKYSKVQKAIPTWIVHALLKRPLDIFGEGASTVDLVHTSDVNKGIVAIVDNFDKCRIQKIPEIAQDVWSNFQAYNEQVLELGTGEEITVSDAVKELEKVLNLPLEVRHLPMRRGEIDGTRLRANISRLSKTAGYEPTMRLTDGLQGTVEYYEKHLSLIEHGKL
jgi:UDP-glucose 4-epimerase